jgi:cytosine/adenosine deaminase-related metal-dependent hydrolase
MLARTYTKLGWALPVGALAALAALGSPRVGAQQASSYWTSQGGVLLEGKIVTMDDQSTVVDGAVLVQNGTVQGIFPKASIPPAPAGCFTIQVPGYIYPGLLNLHNHMTYNELPPYPVPQDYGDRDQWPTSQLYAQMVKYPTNVITGADAFNYETEVVKYSLIKEIVGGVTSVQGAPNLSGCQLLTRSVEWDALGNNSIASRTFAVDQQFVNSLSSNQSTITNLTAWFFHLAEGKDNHARIEYSNPNYNPSQPVDPNTNRPGLKELGLIVPSVVGIHCTALTDTEYADWQATTGGPKIVWSPLSNLLLYGQTTDVVAALNHNALVALGTDWTPSGSKNLLWELKVADQYNKQKLGSALTSEQLARMVTRNPAKLLGWDGQVGEIVSGAQGDLLVLDDLGSGDPYQNLIDATESQVELVFVGGEPLYGDAAPMQALKGGSVLESLNDIPGRSKSLDLQRPNLPAGSESMSLLQQMLDAAAADSADAFAAALNAGDPTQADPYTARESVANYLVGQYQSSGTAIPSELNDPANQQITATDCASYLSLKFPGVNAYSGADPVFELTDDAYFNAILSNLHLTGSSAVLDLTPLQAARTAGTSGTNPSSGTGTTGTRGGTRAPTGGFVLGKGPTTPTGTPSGSTTAPVGSTLPVASTTAASTASPSAQSGGGGGGGGGCTLAHDGGRAADFWPLAFAGAFLVVARRRRRVSRAG